MTADPKQARIAVADAVHLLQTFCGADLRPRISRIEKSLSGTSAESNASVLAASGANAEILDAAGLSKQLAGQINVIPALGILLCLLHIVRPGEVIDYVSLGTGEHRPQL